MLRFRGAALFVALLSVVILAGCGGGGGGDDDGDGTQPPVNLADRTITGKVVSSLDNSRGVANVVVKYGAAYAITNSTGSYTITYVPTQQLLPYYLAVDTSGAGSAYPTTALVKLPDGQTFYPDQINVPLTILNGTSPAMPTIIVEEMTPTSPPSPPYPVYNTMVVGRLVKKSDGSAVANATIRLGVVSGPVQTVVTGSRGYFAFNLGLGNMLVDVVGTDRTFSVDLSTASGFSSTTTVYYSGTPSVTSYFQNQAIEIPASSETIGVVQVNDTDDDGGGPPPPPSI